MLADKRVVAGAADDVVDVARDVVALALRRAIRAVVGGPVERDRDPVGEVAVVVADVGDRVDPEAAAVLVGGPVVLRLDQVLAGIALDGVGAGPVGEHVVPGSAVNEVRARPARDVVGLVRGVRLAEEAVVTRLAVDVVGTVAGAHRVPTGAAVELVAPAAGANPVGAAARVNVVAALARPDDVRAPAGVDGVVAVAGADPVAAGAGVDLGSRRRDDHVGVVGAVDPMGAGDDRRLRAGAARRRGGRGGAAAASAQSAARAPQSLVNVSILSPFDRCAAGGYRPAIDARCASRPQPGHPACEGPPPRCESSSLGVVRRPGQSVASSAAGSTPSARPSSLATSSRARPTSTAGSRTRARMPSPSTKATARSASSTAGRSEVGTHRCSTRRR